ncbi:MAG: hypothetical protein E6J74_05000 [Deltaproteobacteria bacterium]|nr:MAG: hypothetical protein E6J74_05000 [Deltaproteobacteria bacterium]
MARVKLFRWKCGRKTDRRCGICLHCCDERDERNRRIDAGVKAYVPPQDRPGHRLYKGNRQSSESKKAALKKATAARLAKIDDQMPTAGGI